MRAGRNSHWCDCPTRDRRLGDRSAAFGDPGGSGRMPGVIATGDNVLDAITSERVVAILRAPDANRFRDVTLALIDSGVRIIEFTLTSLGALDALRACTAERISGVVIGAGSVINAGAAKSAVEAGAAFLVSPTLTGTVIKLGNRHGVPVIAGGFTPSELDRASKSGAAAVKLFPAFLGGPAYLRALREPLPHLRVIPTGGIAADDVPRYLSAGAIAVGVGTDLVQDSAQSGDFAAITQRAKNLMSRVRGLEGDAQRPG